MLIRVLTTLLIAALLSPSVLQANEADLDQLFIKLKQSSNEAEAREYEGLIYLAWFKSGDQMIDGWMQEAVQQRNSRDFRSALETLDKVIERNPDYSEAWNQRAIINFYSGNHEQSLEDIAKTIELEPRHFGAMAGRAVIRLQQMKPMIALQNVKQAMEFHPYLPERSLFPQLLPQ